MKTFRKILATICAILFVLTTLIALLLFNMDRRAFNAQTYQQAFARADFYNQIPALLAETITSASADQSEFPLAMRGMSTEAWEAFFRSLLPEETLKLMGDDALNSTFAYLNMQTDSAHLDLSPLKTSMAGDAGVQAVFTILKTQPDCTLEQIAEMTLGVLSSGEIGFCNPPEEIYPLLTPLVQGQLQVTAAAIPGQVTIITAPPVDDPRQRLQEVRFFMRLSPILPLAFLLGLTLFAVRSLKSWLGWWGIPFLITGSLAFVISLLGAPIFGAILQRLLNSRAPSFLPAMWLDYSGDLASAMLRALLTPILWQGLLLAVFGLGMTVASYFVKEQRR